MAALAAAGCKNDKAPATAEPATTAKTAEASPAATAAAPAAAAPRGSFDLALPVPAASPTFDVPGARGEPPEEGMTAASYKEMLASEESKVAHEEKLEDGWAIQFKDSDGLVQTAAYRTIGGKALLCRTAGETQAQLDKGRATCLAIRADGANLLVPFALLEDSALVGVGSRSLEVARADESAPKSADEATANARTGLKILETKPVTGGFAVAYQTFNGGIEAQGLIYRAATRAKIGSVDVSCGAWGSPKTAEDAVAALQACTSLRAP